MRKSFKYVGVFAASMCLALNTVSATNLKEQIETGSSGLGDSIKFEKSYDAEKDLNKVLVKLLVDKSAINTVLNQKSGDGSGLSVFYFSINPNLDAANFRKNYIWYGDGLTHQTYESALATLVPSIANEEKTNNGVIWANALSVQYFDSNTNKWLISDTPGDGNTTIKADLLNRLGLDDENDLVYGENYRFSMYDKYTQIWGWDILDSEDKSIGQEFVAIDWEIEFPIAGRVEDRQVLFATLEDAINSESDEIFINKDVVVDDDIVIPENVTVTVAKDVTLEVKEGATLENKGTLLGNVKMDGTNKIYSTVEVAQVENGKVTVDKTNVASGDNVTITATANKDYELDSLKVIDKVTGKEIEIKNDKFVMPENNVEVVSTFKAVSKVVNPKTGDSIIFYIVSSILSLGAIILNSKLFKKIFN